MGLQGMINDMVAQCDFDLSKRGARPEGRRRGDRRALARLITALENGAVADKLKSQLLQDAPRPRRADPRHHRHRRLGQVQPHRRADPPPAPRPGRP
jgi:hypothetical protein